MINNSLFKLIDTIYEDTEMHDWWISLVSVTMGKIIYINEPLHFYRQHSNNTVGAHKKTTSIINKLKKVFNLKEEIRIWRNYQKIVTMQAKELLDRYPNNKHYHDIKLFYDIMTTKNRFIRLYKLIKNDYFPINKSRVLRLVL